MEEDKNSERIFYKDECPVCKNEFHFSEKNVKESYEPITSQNGIKKTWEAVESHDSVSVLLYHNEKKAFLLVKQFRKAIEQEIYELPLDVFEKDENFKVKAKG